MVLRMPGTRLVLTTCQRHHLEPAALGRGHSQNVGHLVDWQRLGHSSSGLGSSLLEVVVAVRNGAVLHDVALVQDVWSRDWDLNVDDVFVGLRRSRLHRHLGQQLAHLCRAQLQTKTRVDVGNLALERSLGKVGTDSGLVVVFRHNLDRLHAERLLAVSREHGNQLVDDNLCLGPVGGGDLDKDVFGVETHLRVVRVDDRRQRAHGPVRVQYHGIHGRISDNVQLRSLVCPLDVVGGVLVELDPELETQLVELVRGVVFAQQGKQIGFVHGDGRHVEEKMREN
ncbi:hypothetical protein OGATHE_001556 [Ogataea polymorpha]|uniref:Uncharacterized protein n=1 Tax=Ogataea polymorpha TaxID=460523 RepID=A0A9P8TEB2_9ASCO|nr:hypothetical protein OGATHE_001556 [Ogataea polymorpha]